MAEIQPPNTQALRPQHLTQVGHEGNPVEFFIDVDSTLDSPNPFCQVDCGSGGGDLGGPIPYPISGSGGGGGGGDTITLPLSGGSGTMNCVSGETNVPLTVTGGVGPYSWSTSAGVLGSPTTTLGQNTLNPATNSGGPHPNAEAGGVCVMFCGPGGFPNCNGVIARCDGTFDECTSVGIQTVCTAAGYACTCGGCAGCDGLSYLQTGVGGPPVGCCDLPTCDPVADCEGCLGAYGSPADTRDSGDTAGGCNPCITQFINPPTITVTDANGDSVIFTVPVAYTP